MSDDINVIIYDEQTIDVVMEDEQPVSVTIIEDVAQAISVNITGGIGSSDIFSGPPSGCYQIVNMYLDASLNIVVVYNDVAIP